MSVSMSQAAGRRKAEADVVSRWRGMSVYGKIRMLTWKEGKEGRMRMGIEGSVGLYIYH